MGVTDVDGADSVGTLGTGCTSSAACEKISESFRNASVWLWCRLIGANVFFCLKALMRSCAANLMESPGSIVGCLQCCGKNLDVFAILYPLVSGM